MDILTTPRWHDHFVRTASARNSSQLNSFYRSVRRGHFIRLAPGIYLPTRTWTELTVDERQRARILAVADTLDGDRLYSHLTAAALWRLPSIDPWPTRIETLVDLATGSRTRSAVRTHVAPLPASADRIDGLRVTSLVRTVVDVARTASMSTSVAMADRALAGVSIPGSSVQLVELAALLDELASINRPRGRTKATASLRFADPLSGSPGESLSRVAIHVLGLPAPILQHEFRDAAGSMFVDFWWPEYNVIGEFDGFGKYLREELRPGQSIADAVLAEKHRENRLRALGPTVGRWGWADARSLPTLAGILRNAGLPVR